MHTACRLERTAWTAIAILILLVTPTSSQSAQAAHDLELTAAQSVVQDAAYVEAELVAFVHDAGHTDVPSTARMLLTAQNLLVEVDQVEGSTDAMGAQAGGDEDTRFAFYRDAALEQTGVRDRYEVTIFPLPGEPAPRFQARDTKCLHFAAIPSTTAAASSHVDAEREPPSTDVTNSISVGSECRDDFLLEGSFQVSLWDLDFHIRAPNTTAYYQTGDFPRQGVDDPTGNTRGVHSADRYQAFLRIYNGTLRFEGITPDTTSIHLRAVAFTDARTMRLEHARGGIASDVVLPSPSNVVLRGEMAARLEPGPDHRLHVEGLEGVESIQIDQQSSRSAGLATVTPLALGNSGLLMGLALAAVVLVATWVLLSHTRQVPSSRLHTSLDHVRRMLRRGPEIIQRRIWKHCVALYRHGRHRRVGAWTAFYIWFWPGHPFGFALRALAASERGRFGCALRLHDRAHRRFAPHQAIDKAHNAYEAARTSSRLGKSDRALAWLRVAVQLDPSFLVRADTEPDFGTHDDDGRFLVGIQELRVLYGGRYMGV